MKKLVISFLVVGLLFAYSGIVTASSLQMIPKEALGYIQLTNIGKTIDTVDKFIHEIDPQSAKKGQSLAQALGQAIGNNTIKNKTQLEAETGIKMSGDLTLFWPSNNPKAKAYAYPVVEKESVLASLKQKKGDPRQPVTVYSGVELYIFSKNPPGAQVNPMAINQECIFFLDDYLVNCSDETTARMIINTYQGQSEAITSNAKYLTVKNSIRAQEITAYCNLESVIQMFLPLIQMFGGMATQQLGAMSQMQQPNMEKVIPPQQMQNMAAAGLRLVIWFLEQLESAGFSVHLGEKGLLIDDFIGFKKESLIQDFLVHKKDKIDYMKYLPENSIIAFDSKLNPEIFSKIYQALLDNMDASLLRMTPDDYQEWKESVLTELKSNLSYMGYEISLALLPGEGKLPFRMIEIIEVTDSKKAQSAYQNQMNFLNIFDPLMKGFAPELNSAEAFEIKGKTNYKGIQITTLKFNVSRLNYGAKINKNDLLDLETNLWYAVSKNKLLICMAETDDLIKLAIDSISKGNSNPLIKNRSYQAAIRSLPADPDSLSFISVVSYMKALFAFTKPMMQQQCFNVMKDIENGSNQYYRELGKNPQTLNDLFMKGLDRYKVQRTGDTYTLAPNSGKVACATHGSLANPIPLNQVSDKYTETLSFWEGDIDGIGIRTKNQNGGVTQNIDTPIEVFKSLAKMIRRLAAAKKKSTSTVTQ